MSIGRLAPGSASAILPSGLFRIYSQDSRDFTMGYPFPPDIQQAVGARMASGQYPSEDDLLREALRALEEQDEDLAAVNEAVAEWRAGDGGVPLDDAFTSLRKKHRLP